MTTTEIAPNSSKITDLTELLEVLDDFWNSVNSHRPIRLWYRGQVNSQWGLIPGVYRDSFKVTTESQRLEKEQQLNQDFKVHSASLLSGNPSDTELYFLQQHYKMPTRLLDWSTSPLTAFYFAVSEEDHVDGSLFMMDAYQLAISQGADKDIDNGFRGTPTSSLPLFRKAIETFKHWKKADTFPKYIIPIRPYYTDKRILLQKGCFTFHVPDQGELSERHNSTLRKYIILVTWNPCRGH